MHLIWQLPSSMTNIGHRLLARTIVLHSRNIGRLAGLYKLGVETFGLAQKVPMQSIVWLSSLRYEELVKVVPVLLITGLVAHQRLERLLREGHTLVHGVQIVRAKGGDELGD